MGLREEVIERREKGGGSQKLGLYIESDGEGKRPCSLSYELPMHLLVWKFLGRIR